jgi:hypothetical protein
MLKRMRFLSLIPVYALALLLGAGSALAQTTTPGVPSTGEAGAMDVNATVLLVSAAVVLVGALYLFARRSKTP